MILRTDNFHLNQEPNPVDNPVKMLSDDAFQNHAYFDRRGYLHICQSLSGNRRFELELAPSEAVKLASLLKEKIL